jgi:hypothetical protein
MNHDDHNRGRIFASYAEFVRLTRILSEEQLSTVRQSLSDVEMEHLRNSRDEGGFYQLESANEFDDCMERIEAVTDFSPVRVRLQLLHGRRVRIPTVVWDTIISELGHVDSSFSAILTDGIVCRRDAKKAGYVVLTLGGRAS